MAVALRSVHVVSLFGRNFDLRLVGLGDGLNVVYAENGIGKSTVATGVAAMFDPTGQPRSTRVHAEFESEGNMVSVLLNGNNVEPSLWQNARAGLCRLGISDILRAEDPDSPVLVAALAGGIDLATVLPVSRPKVPNMNSVVERLTARERQARKVAEDEAELEAKVALSEELVQAVKDLALAQRWLEAIDLDEQAAAIELVATAITTEFPGIAEQSEDAVEQTNSLFTHWVITEDQLRVANEALSRIAEVTAKRSLTALDRAAAADLREQLVGLRSRSAEAERDLQHRQDALENALTLLGNVGGDRELVPADGISEELVVQARHLDTAVEDALRRFGNAQSDRDRAVRAEATLREGLAVTVPLPNAVLDALLATPAVPDVADDARARKTECKVLTEVSDSVAREAAQSKKVDPSVVRALVDWLAATPSGDSAGSAKDSLRWWAVVGALLLAIGAQSVVGSWSGLVVMAAGAIVAAALARRRTGQPDTRKSVVSRIPADIHPPVWDSASVAARLEELLLAKTNAEAKSAWSAELARRAQGVDTGTAADLEERIRQFEAATGVAAPSDRYRFGDLLHRLGVWHKAVAARDAALQHCADEESAWKTALRVRQDWLGQQPGGRWTTGNIYVECVKECRRIGQLQHELQIAKSRLKSFQKQQTEAFQDAEQLAASYEFPVRGDWISVLEIFPTWFDTSEAESDAREALVQALSRFGVPESDNLPDRLETLRRREQDALRYREATKTAEVMRSQAKALRQDIDQTVWHRQSIRPESVRADWEALRDRLADSSGKKTEVDKTIGSIQKSIELAESAGDWFILERDADQQLREASRWIDRNLQCTANQLVREAIECSVGVENIPAVVERAHHWMQAFTGGRYDRIGIVRDEAKEGQRHLVVRDLADGGREKRLGELSTGTRAHVALAVRLAVLEESERGGQRLPLLVDEILATSGAEARDNIATALRDIARERQVVYFTNSAADIELLAETGPGAGTGVVPDVRQFVLSGSPEPVIPAGDPEPPSVVIPEPDGLPLWQLVLEWTPGWREHFFGLGWDSSPEHAQTLVRAAEAVRVRLAGCVRRLEWAHLVTSGLVTETMVDRIRNHYDATGGDARRFLATLGDIDGVGKTALQKYSNWLSEQGYFEPLPTRQELVQTAQACLSQLPANSGVLAHGIVALFEAYMKLE
jgi:hypothetical protein